MYQGDYEVLSKGVYGKADVTANVTVINGTETAREVVSSRDAEGAGWPSGRHEAPRSGPRGSPYRVLPLALLRRHHFLISAGATPASAAPAATMRGHRYRQLLRYAIYAADGGTVIYSGWNGGRLLREDRSRQRLYHMVRPQQRPLRLCGRPRVQRGQTIAAMGSTGISSGSHCDFRIQRNGTMVDPLNYLP